MDKISESLLKEFSQEHNLTSLPEKDRFEHFACYVTVRRHHPESFDSEDLITGDGDTGIDGVAILADGLLITDCETLQEQADAAGQVSHPVGCEAHL